MKISDIPFVTTDWSQVPPERHAGDVGEAIWRTQYFGPDENRIRVRMVEYSPGYVADHWCSKGPSSCALTAKWRRRSRTGA
jgi:hypothetical protein